MMKIGILTLPFNNNYGGYLQAYALMTVLKSMGHQVVLIYRRNNRRSKKRRIKMSIKNIFKAILGKDVISIIPNQEAEHRFKGQKMMRFVDRYITPISKPLFSSSAMYKYIRNSNFDMIVVGSDQVWRPDYGQEHVQDFFLTDLKQDNKGKPRLISYAASFGADRPCYTEREMQECGEALKNFVRVSLREQKGLEIIINFKWKCQNNPEVVLDPTFLLPVNHYKSLLPSDLSVAHGKMFCYFLDKSDDSLEIQKEVSRLTGLELFSVIDTQNWQKKDYIMPSIEDWLSGIRDAAFVLTDSYHGMVFSIIFNKPFLVKCNESRGAGRFSTVLSLLNLENRLVSDVNNISEVIKSEMNWKGINEKLNEIIGESKRFLAHVMS